MKATTVSFLVESVQNEESMHGLALQDEGTADVSPRQVFHKLLKEP